MSPLKLLPPAIFTFLLAASLPSSAQQANTEFKITKIEPAFQESPTYSGVRYDKRVNKAASWLEVEVTFEWQPRAAEPKYTEELTANYYILLNTPPSKQFPKQVLLTGSVNLASIAQAKDLRTVVYVSPRTLERFFDGKAPGTVNAALVDVGVTLSKQGQMVATTSWKGRGEWWTTFQQSPGYVLNKNETPFAPLAWDYYEAIKPKGPGL